MFIRGFLTTRAIGLEANMFRNLKDDFPNQKKINEKVVRFY